MRYIPVQIFKEQTLQKICARSLFPYLNHKCKYELVESIPNHIREIIWRESKDKFGLTYLSLLPSLPPSPLSPLSTLPLLSSSIPFSSLIKSIHRELKNPLVLEYDFPDPYKNEGTDEALLDISFSHSLLLSLSFSHCPFSLKAFVQLCEVSSQRGGSR